MLWWPCLELILKCLLMVQSRYLFEYAHMLAWLLELRQYKNDSIWSEDKLALNLPRFFTRLYGQ